MIPDAIRYERSEQEVAAHSTESDKVLLPDQNQLISIRNLNSTTMKQVSLTTSGCLQQPLVVTSHRSKPREVCSRRCGDSQTNFLISNLNHYDFDVGGYLDRFVHVENILHRQHFSDSTDHQLHLIEPNPAHSDLEIIDQQAFARLSREHQQFRFLSFSSTRAQTVISHPVLPVHPALVLQPVSPSAPVPRRRPCRDRFQSAAPLPACHSSGHSQSGLRFGF